MIIAKKNAAYYLSFPAVDSTTPAAYKTGISPVDDAYSKDGAGVWTALAITDTAAEIGSTGVYEIDLTAAEMNHDQVFIKFAVSGMADDGYMFDLSTKLVDDLNDFNSATDAVADVTLCATTTTLTGHTNQTADHTAGIADIPTVSEFNARSLASADYTIVSDLGTVQTGDSFALIGTAGAGLTNLGASGNDWNTIVPDAAGVAPTTAEIATGVWTDTTAGDFTTALSVGKSVMNGVTLGTGLTTVSVSGAVGSVTGAVGSVAGNVDGSVGSLTGHTNQTADHTAGIADIPTVAEFNARTLATASYFDPTADTVANVTTVATTTTNTDMRGTDSAALATALATAQLDLDAITDTDGIIIGAAAVDLVWDEVLTGATHNVTSSAGKRLRQIDAAFEITSGTAVAGSTSTTINLNSADGADAVTDEIYAGDRCVIVAGTGVGEHGLILSYASSTQIATMSKAWVITPDNTSEYILSPADCDVELWNDNSVTGDGDWAALKAETAAIVLDTGTTIPATITTAQDDLDIITGASGVNLLTATQASVDAIETDTGTTIPAQITALNNISAANVNTEVVDVIRTDTATELSAVPAASPDLMTMVQFIYMALRNKMDVTATTKEIHNDAGTIIGTKTVSDDATTYSETKAS